jgi:hypothetical protein
MNSFSDDALRWAGASFVLVITLSCFGFVVFFREYFQKKNFFLIFLIFGVVVLNSLTLFAWESNLLGQISGLPVLLLFYNICVFQVSRISSASFWTVGVFARWALLDLSGDVLNCHPISHTNFNPYFPSSRLHIRHP